MNAAERLAPITVEDYLAGEERADQKHEYVDGMIYAMAGGRYAHNLIASNIVAELHAQFKGTPCRALNSDNKIRVESETRSRFYYPDASVVCGDNILEGVYQEKPTIVIEVLSRSTRRTDEGEKQQAYLQIPTLDAYLLVEQRIAAATVYHREGDSFRRQIYAGRKSIIELPTVGAKLLLADVYAEVNMTREP